MGTETPSGKVMIDKKIYIAIILVVIVVGAFAVILYYSGYFSKSPTSTYNLKIAQFEREFIAKADIGGGDYNWAWWVHIKIQNKGSNDVNGAELVVELKEDHTTIDSQSESFLIQAGWETTESVIIQAKQSEYLGKNVILVATIYLGSEVLDQYTTSW